MFSVDVKQQLHNTDIGICKRFIDIKKKHSPFKDTYYLPETDIVQGNQWPVLGAAVAQCVKRWPTDLVEPVRSRLEAKSSQP